MSEAKTTNALDVLGAVSGLGRPAVDSILAEVRANNAKLDACPRHDFVGVADGAIKCKDGLAYQRYRCTNCGGKVDSSAARWYRLGLEHGSGRDNECSTTELEADTKLYSLNGELVDTLPAAGENHGGKQG